MKIINCFRKRKMGRSLKKIAQRKRHSRKTTEELNQINFPKKDPEFIFRKLTKREVSEDLIMKDLRALKSSKLVWDFLSHLIKKKTVQAL